MLSIFICEDDEHYLGLLSKYVKDYTSIENYDMELTLCTSNPNDIINYIKDRQIDGLYFLDVELKDGNNGVELARAIRQYDPRGFIAFITSHPQYMQITFEYQVEAMAYIQKTPDANAVRQKICECIKNAHTKYVTRADKGRFIFKSTNGRKVACYYDDILFFETDPLKDKQVVLHTYKRQYAFYDTINGVYKNLPKGQFFKCKNSNIVNVNNLTEDCLESLIRHKEYMIMPDGTECSVAFRKRKELIRLMSTVVSGR